MTVRNALSLAVALAVLPACFDTEPDLGRSRYACLSDAECLGGYVCRAHAEGKYCTPYTEAPGVDTAGPSADTVTDVDAGAGDAE